MEIFQYENYLELLQAWLMAQPKKGRGVGQKMAAKLRVSSVLMSQIFNGSRTLQLDYAFGIAQFMGLNSSETDYFLLLVQFENAGTTSYRDHLRKLISHAKKDANKVKHRVSQDIQLSEEAKARFYSHWHYSAIRLLTDIPHISSVSAMAEILGIESSRVSEILDFLVDKQLCIKANGRYKMAVQSTHLESDSPWIYSRQLQWRQKALHSMESPRSDSLYYTAPMVLSRADKIWVREKLLQLIKELTERARGSTSESLACLNIDWFSLDSSI